MSILESISGPRDLRSLDDAELETLASEIRDLLVRSTSKVGGHLGPNLGVVELTMANVQGLGDLDSLFAGGAALERRQHRAPAGAIHGGDACARRPPSAAQA